jgi:hypothetical protein
MNIPEGMIQFYEDCFLDIGLQCMAYDFAVCSQTEVFEVRRRLLWW